ncbi:MAG: glycoside hydrolase family 37 [Firmicutes bacterium]|nr:glycoside hydrolase family 37 [Bacillota bacterium]
MWDELQQYVKNNLSRMQREAGGILKYPYIVPGSANYSGTLWDWDSWWTCVAMGQAETDEGEAGRYLPYEQGCVLNFLDHMDASGKIPITLSNSHFYPEREADYCGRNNHKPCLAQHAAFITRKCGDLEWIRPHLQELETFAGWFLIHATHAETGLAYWENDFAVGVDNEPVVYFRPAASSGALYLNCLLYREELALAWLLEEAGETERAARWRKIAGELAEAVRTHCWDDRDHSFYSVDLNLLPVHPDQWLHHEEPRFWPCLLMRYDTWTNFLPLWAGIATPEQAGMMLKHLQDPARFMGKYGVRTLSAGEKMYNLRATNNPSNWLGPVWGISNYMVFRGLVRYGLDGAAEDLARRTADLLQRDIETTGTLHEFYDPDTGTGIRTPDFQNWNCLVLNMIAWLEGRECTEEY